MLRRYLYTTRIFWAASVAADMEYRANFVMATFSSLVNLGGAVFTLYLLFRTGYRMGGWTWQEALVVVGMFTILEGVQSSFLAPNRTSVTEHVREGTLDFVLLKPVDSQFWLSVRRISLWGLPNILVGLVIVVAAGAMLERRPGPGTYLLGLLPLALGIVVLYSVGYILSTFTIWFIKLYNITMAMHALLETGRYPIPAYPHAYQVFFTFVLPVAFMTTVPARVIIGEPATVWLGGSFVVAVVLFAISRVFWRFALRYYTSASS